MVVFIQIRCCKFNVYLTKLNSITYIHFPVILEFIMKAILLLSFFWIVSASASSPEGTNMKKVNLKYFSLQVHYLYSQVMRSQT